MIFTRIITENYKMNKKQERTENEKVKNKDKANCNSHEELITITYNNIRIDSKERYLT